MAQEQVVDLHRVVKEVLEKLVFSCPKCQKVKRTYTEIFSHMQECDGKELTDSVMKEAHIVAPP